jgi:hypothetical protein
MSKRLVPSAERLARTANHLRSTNHCQPDFSVSLDVSAYFDGETYQLLRWTCEPARNETPAENRAVDIVSELDSTYAIRPEGAAQLQEAMLDEFGSDETASSD